MFALEEIRRREDGSIDVRFYGNRGLAERRAVIASAFRGLKRPKVVLIAALLGAALYLAPTGNVASVNYPTPENPRLVYPGTAQGLYAQTQR